MYHSITIGNKNTFSDWHLLSLTPPVVAPPAPKTRYLDILGRSGSLDYTEALTKFPTYSDREGSWEFIILNPSDTDQYTIEDEGDYKYDFEDLISEIMQYLHGRYFEWIVLEDDPFSRYSGRVWLGNVQRSKDWNTITINYRLNPVKLRVRDTTDGFIQIDQSSISGVASNVSADITAEPGCMSTQLALRAESSREHVSSTNTDGFAVCRARFVNPELGIDYFFTFASPSNHTLFSDLRSFDVTNGIKNRAGYYPFDEVLKIPNCIVSNYSRNNVCKLHIGVANNSDTWFRGPAYVTYSWTEAIL